MVHVTDVKKITLTEQVADEYEKLGKEGRFSKKCIPQGYIPDFDWTTIHQSQDQPIKPIQQQDPTEDTTTPAAPTEIEGPPSSHLRSKMKQQHTSHKQEQLECNPTPMDPAERNPAEIEVNSIDITPLSYSWMRLTRLISYSRKIMTRLLSAYPKKFHNQFIFFSTNFVPFPLKETTQSITQIVQILSCHIFIF